MAGCLTDRPADFPFGGKPRMQFRRYLEDPVKLACRNKLRDSKK
jgi:hypothetical protein